MLRRLGAFARVIAIDRRGMGLSDPLAPGRAEPLETHIDDVIAVMAAAHVDRACVFASENVFVRSGDEIVGTPRPHASPSRTMLLDRRPASV